MGRLYPYKPVQSLKDKSGLKVNSLKSPSLRGRAAKKYGPMSGMDMLIKVTKPKKYL